jgi:hypothetical protein
VPPRRILATLALLALPLVPLAAQRHTPDSAAATILGTVYDSVGGRRLAGAIVQVVPIDRRGGAYSAEADADGMFRIPGVPRDRYLIGFLHPAADSLGLSATPRTIDVHSDSAVYVALALPSAATIRAQLCAPSDTRDSTGLLLGFVRDADTGLPLAGSTVVVMWNELVIDQRAIRQEQRQRPVKTGDEGWFAICGLPTDAPLAARAELGKRASGYIEIAVPPRALLHRDFGIPADSAALAIVDTATERAGEPRRRGTARITGVVRGPNGRLLAGAQVMAWESGSSTTTASDGTFAFTSLPAGTQMLEARFVGYVPKRLTVDLASGRSTSATITLSERVTTLDAVQVFGKRSRRSSDLNGFLQRSQKGMGRYITAEEIERRNPFQFSDLLYAVPGVHVVPSGGPYERAIQMRGGCTPTIYIDHIQLTHAEDIDFMVSPRDIIGVEIYSIATAPVEFRPGRSMSGCGSIVIWTGARPRK